MTDYLTYRYVSSSPFSSTPAAIQCRDGRSIPLDVGNMDYVELMREVEAGRVTIEPLVAFKPTEETDEIKVERFLGHLGMTAERFQQALAKHHK